ALIPLGFSKLGALKAMFYVYAALGLLSALLHRSLPRSRNDPSAGTQTWVLFPPRRARHASPHPPARTAVELEAAVDTAAKRGAMLIIALLRFRANRAAKMDRGGRRSKTQLTKSVIRPNLLCCTMQPIRL